MPKINATISADQLKFQISKVEAERNFDTLGELWEAMADTDWAKGFCPYPLTASYIRAKAIELQVQTKTQSGKKSKNTVINSYVPVPASTKATDDDDDDDGDMKPLYQAKSSIATDYVDLVKDQEIIFYDLMKRRKLGIIQTIVENNGRNLNALDSAKVSLKERTHIVVIKIKNPDCFFYTNTSCYSTDIVDVLKKEEAA